MRVLKTEEFDRWLDRLRDRKGAATIRDRIARYCNGGVANVAPIGDGMGELRVHFGPGYLVYFKQKGEVVLLLLCGGDKDTQRRDITRAKKIAKEWKDGLEGK
jgi:putative addiction module killer protein